MKVFISILLLFISFTSIAQFITNGDMETFDTYNPNRHSRCNSIGWEKVDGIGFHNSSLTCPTLLTASKLSKYIIKSINDETVMYIGAGPKHGDNGETFGQKLKKKLIKGYNYQVSFDATYENELMSPTPNYRTPVLIMSFNYDKPESNDDIVSSVYNDSTFLFYETNWRKRTFCFTAPDTGIGYISFSNLAENPKNKYSYILVDNVEIIESPTQIYIEDTILCQGDTLTFDISHENASAYLWQGTTIQPTKDSIFSITEKGIYWSEVKYPCSVVRDTITVREATSPSFSFDLNTDTSFCIGDSLELMATYPKGKYLWQDNSTDSNYTVTKEGTYWVQITDQCDSKVSDTVDIDYHEPIHVDLGNDKVLCKGDSIILYIPDTNLSYVWQDKSTKHYYVLNEQGKYWVDVSNECESVNDTITITTPNSPSIDSLKHLNSYYFTIEDNIFDEYQWIYCDSTKIPDATDPTLIVSSDGMYSLVTEKYGCIDTSNCITVGIKEIKESELKLYPNPTMKYIFIEYSGSFNRMKIIVRNVLGQFIQQEEFTSDKAIQQLNLFGSSGTYNFEVQIDDGKPEFFSIVKQ